MHFALDHLAKTGPEQNDFINLPAGSPFGRISVNGDACTLCMGCTSVCPAKAIKAGDEEPKLVFHEHTNVLGYLDISMLGRFEVSTALQLGFVGN